MIGADTTFLVQLEIQELPEHPRAHEILRREILIPGRQLVLAPQVIAEFIHVFTDAKRFQRPLSMEAAIDKAQFWWNAREVTHVFPNAPSVELSLQWLAKYSLGRKRLLDTQLAATFWTAGIRSIITSNLRDFAIFAFKVIAP